MEINSNKIERLAVDAMHGYENRTRLSILGTYIPYHGYIYVFYFFIDGVKDGFSPVIEEVVHFSTVAGTSAHKKMIKEYILGARPNIKAYEIFIESSFYAIEKLDEKAGLYHKIIGKYMGNIDSEIVRDLCNLSQYLLANYKYPLNYSLKDICCIVSKCILDTFEIPIHKKIKKYIRKKFGKLEFEYDEVCELPSSEPKKVLKHLLKKVEKVNIETENIRELPVLLANLVNSSSTYHVIKSWDSHINAADALQYYYLGKSNELLIKTLPSIANIYYPTFYVPIIAFKVDVKEEEVVDSEIIVRGLFENIQKIPIDYMDYLSNGCTINAIKSNFLKYMPYYKEIKPNDFDLFEQLNYHFFNILSEVESSLGKDDIKCPMCKSILCNSNINDGVRKEIVASDRDSFCEVIKENWNWLNSESDRILINSISKWNM